MTILKLRGRCSTRAGKACSTPANCDEIAPSATLPTTAQALQSHMAVATKSRSAARLHTYLGVVEVRHRLHNGLGALDGVSGLEDAGADKHTIHTELHHERSVGGRGDTASGKVDNGQLASPGNLLHQLEWSLQEWEMYIYR
eukprot:TRINITY_DN4598_c0_g1_i2.p2 TRINITY_DN4598_c0_g1~~TRINITY_DN4598_c0_g1_i2.p2  ORF type:complete len:142 (+),score=14.16 TRINITY_DN4598_c0_g1_i2:1153-1578(+)